VTEEAGGTESPASGSMPMAQEVRLQYYSVGNLEKRVPYDPEMIDLFFIVDGDLNIYLIPSRVIAGRVGILLRTYERSRAA
jgi:hypothetical protein